MMIHNRQLGTTQMDS